jgi:Holliday junction resolvase RusA-like endonuclease
VSHRFVCQGPPVPKQRPRLGKNGAWYTPKNTVVYENTIAWVIAKENHRYGNHPLWLRAEFHMPTERKVDVDNLLKALLDGCQKGLLFVNDWQVMELSASVFYCSEHARTEWEVGLLTELPHQIHCNGDLVAVELGEDGEWICTGCGKPVGDWVVSPFLLQSST